MKNLIKKWLGLTDSVKIGIKLTDAKIPTYTRDGDACVDLRATHDITIKPKETALVKTGIKIQFIPKGWMLRVTNRSGMALKNRILVGNSDGVIDEAYTGDIGVILHNLGTKAFVIEKGDRIAQMYPQKVIKFDFVETEVERESNRGANGFNSSGVK